MVWLEVQHEILVLSILHVVMSGPWHTSWEVSILCAIASVWILSHCSASFGTFCIVKSEENVFLCGLEFSGISDRTR